MGAATHNPYPQLTCLGSAVQYVDDIFEIIEQIKLFEHFSFDEIAALCRYMTCFGAPAGTRLLTEGCDGDYMMLILTGEVAISKKNSTGEETRIAVIPPGMSLGEMSLIDGKPRFASCDTLLPTDFAVLSRHSLNEILVQMPRLGNKLLLELLQITTERLRETTTLQIPNIAATLA